MNSRIEISNETLLKIALFILLCYFLFIVCEILLWVLFAFVLAVLFEKPISLLAIKIPRPVAALIVYFSFFILLIGSIYFISLPLFKEVNHFIKLIPNYFEKISPSLKTLGIISFESFQELTQKLQSFLVSASKNFVSAVSAVFGSLMSAFSIFSLAFFLSIEEKSMEKIIALVFGKKKETVLKIWEEIKEKISFWFGLKIIGSLFCTFLCFISLLVLKINYPISLSFLFGIANFIPILGPLFAGSLIVIIAILDSFYKGILILILLFLIQIIEGNVLVPILARKYVELPPFLILLSLLIGGKLMGIWGAILAMPLSGFFFRFFQRFFEEEKF
jgi:predicted PurR-regulated permease PerM